ncbi:hypothetical protein Agabi119p4_11078 [Agaricus bisporus var. burnettii]|uniref:Uncharacterized protein n=1 Tax=Agaricus bisporus var. burnettii TaxID=192524 RepID=A0A8H7C152_AGABI|nr:hypothetical protein Agabi119p4_11078 [Agaricus bisporus var. burnettii]
MVQFSVLGDPTEYDAYGVITEAFILHKIPRNRYTIFPQLFLPWKPDEPLDTRGSLPDFGLGRYYPIAPHIRLQGGCEVKKATWLMEDLPPTNVISKESDVLNVVKLSKLQAEDQAKSAVKGNLLPPNQKLLWLIFVGPYFMIHEVGPFTAQQLASRSHRPNDSGDFAEFA